MRKKAIEAKLFTFCKFGLFRWRDENFLAVFVQKVRICLSLGRRF